jgi:hypothetical protein
MKYIVYQTVNKVNNKIYIGVHGTCKNNFDGYIGCGVDIFRPSTYLNPKTPFQAAVKKYGIKNFIRTTLKEFDTMEEAYTLEAELVNEDFIKREDVYNLALGGKFHPENANPKKEVHMYDLDGNYIKSFKSINEAAFTLNPNAVNGSHISRAIKCGYVYQQHQWSYEKVPFMKKIKAKKPKSFNTINSPKVGRFDKNNNLLEIFENLTECRKAGYSNANKVLQGERNYCKGFGFKYLD